MGSIPASAGKPRPGRRDCCCSGVYPRECGETHSSTLSDRQPAGLSPRVRGNRGNIPSLPNSIGSIPASAGKPSERTSLRNARRVYPRECGETHRMVNPNVSVAGLSPRVRGNPRKRLKCPIIAGSIPASAGKPRGQARGRRRWGVYPRECGETVGAAVAEIELMGLSPRVRGNREYDGDAAVGAGSIPASAGKPQWYAHLSLLVGVYPRECGETAARRSRVSNTAGLSPRVRGNRSTNNGWINRCGSIPASAGKPPMFSCRLKEMRVYPRECGETTIPMRRSTGNGGLSPRVRGNHQQGRGR